MKHLEFYRRYSISNFPGKRSIITSKTWWNLLAVLAAVLIEPFILYGRHRPNVRFSLSFYLHVMEVSVLILCALSLFIAMFYWHELANWWKGYGWVGTFEVKKKHSTFLLCYILLTPGEGQRIRVSRTFFESVRVGDSVEVKRNALGYVYQVSRVGKFRERFKRRITKYPGKSKLENFERNKK